MSFAIKTEGLSKKYLIGHQRQDRYETLRDVLMHKARGLRERIRHPLSPNREDFEQEELWALKDVSLEIGQGEKVGIIGRNGAGKTTLLKLLSRITEPSQGRFTINGRVSSLLEVGTGFHPELSGRENIFLNGAILGMSKAEVRARFDEIVAFSEVEKFLDTPVKRYSSGMYVRLAFSVAAHLEPEILIVDEVLAVGDAAFQKKCLGKMEEFGSGGRTVLFVSHKMSSIKAFCNRCVLLERGRVEFMGDTDACINRYLGLHKENFRGQYRNHKLLDHTDIDAVAICDTEGNITTTFASEDSISVRFRIKVAQLYERCTLGIRVQDQFGRSIFSTQADLSNYSSRDKFENLSVSVPGGFLIPGPYQISLGLHIPNAQILRKLENVIGFEIVNTGSEFDRYKNSDLGCVNLPCHWSNANEYPLTE